MKSIPPLHRKLLLLTLLFFAAVPAPAKDQEWLPREPVLPEIPARTYRVTDFGAVGDGSTMNTGALRAAVAACAKGGGGRVVVPAGTFVTGPIELTGRMGLVLEKGAVLQASGKFEDFGLPSPLPATQAEIDGFKNKLRPLISGTKLSDVAIVGEGIIDGAGAGWWAKSDKVSERAVLTPDPADPTRAVARPLYVPRPHLVVLRDCVRVHVQGVSLRNSPMFHLVPHHCREVLVEDVTIFSPADAPNTDGIDPANTREMLIRHCTIDTGDDDIALKGGGVGGEPTENVTVSDCTFLHGHGVSIGSETQAGVRNFLVQRCTFENTGTAIRIKSDRTRGGVIENVTYRDIRMKNVEAAITVFLYYDDKKAAAHPEPKAVTENTPIVRGLHFLNITCEGVKKAGEIAGLPESPISDVVLENVRITGAGGPFTQQDIRNLRMLNVDIQSEGVTAK